MGLFSLFKKNVVDSRISADYVNLKEAIEFTKKHLKQSNVFLRMKGKFVDISEDFDVYERELKVLWFSCIAFNKYLENRLLIFENRLQDILRFSDEEINYYYRPNVLFSDETRKIIDDFLILKKISYYFEKYYLMIKRTKFDNNQVLQEMLLPNFGLLIREGVFKVLLPFYENDAIVDTFIEMQNIYRNYFDKNKIYKIEKYIEQ